MNIFLVGDVMLGRLYNKKIPYNKIWGDSLPYLKKSDLIVGNLEMTITDHDVPYPDKVFNYKLSKDLAMSHFKPLFGKTVFNTANNHILDYNLLGMKDTYNFLKRYKCYQVGSGINLKDASKYLFLKMRGKKIIVFGAADHYDYWEAGVRTQLKGLEGVWFLDIRNYGKRVLDCLKYVKDVIKREKPDLAIFSCHWGPNSVPKVSTNIRKFGRALIESGIDIVHGHSAHHIIPPEKYKNGVIFHSLGDFVNDYDHSGPFNKQLSYGVMINLEDRKKFTYKIHLFNHDKMTVKEIGYRNINKEIK